MKITVIGTCLLYTSTQHLKPGDVIETMIVNVDRKTRSINLSIKAKDHVEQSQAMQKLSLIHI